MSYKNHRNRISLEKTEENMKSFFFFFFFYKTWKENSDIESLWAGYCQL